MENTIMNNAQFCELEETELMTLTGGSKGGASDVENKTSQGSSGISQSNNIGLNAGPINNNQLPNNESKTPCDSNTMYDALNRIL